MKHEFNLTSALYVVSEIRRAVLPLVLSGQGRAITGKASSGDATYRLDEVAEEALYAVLKEKQYAVACCSEDRGVVKLCDDPSHLLVVDPVDGTRPAAVGFEMACVSLAAAPYGESPALRDVAFAVVQEIKTGRLFYAERGKGAHVFAGDEKREIRLTRNTDLDRLAWSFELAGRPSAHVFGILGELIDRSSIRGTVLLFSSTSFSLTRLLTGQFDAVVDVGERIWRERPAARDEFLRCGGGDAVMLAPYDIAAAAVIAEEGGAVVTDACGTSLDGLPLADTTAHTSLIAANTPKLHAALVDYVNGKFESSCQGES